MLPRRMFGHPDGMIFETVMDRATHGMRHAAAHATFLSEGGQMDRAPIERIHSS